MEAFPFTSAEWDPLEDLADSILNASSYKDDALAESLRLELLERLAALRARHGDHPVLLETAADYTEAAAERAVLYRRAVEIAEAHGLPTLSIRTSFAPVLVKLGEPAAALEELQACGREAVSGDADEREGWFWELKDVPHEAASDAQRSALYRRAEEIARAHGLPTLSIRLLHIRFLLDVGQLAAAREELRGCEDEASRASEDDQTFFKQLCGEASPAEPGAAPDTAR
ncbi:hypothetical protein R5W23_005655 [Gemmata sp. JC673]|uniref:Tetratricopeptide repeat protein n=1 Tax=Gemmata algarum TaxID=2975278 RepID=A0ABU5ETK5_9BACT|nr:hypothetical protein [Gemmata algarum]MDY3558535.1 hypothetical protein [Gemmata algarum]